MGDKSEILKSSSPEKETTEAISGSQAEIQAPEIVTASEAEIAGQTAEETDLLIRVSDSRSKSAADSESALNSGADRKRLVNDCVVRARNNFKIFKNKPFLSRKKFIQLKDQYQKLES